MSTGNSQIVRKPSSRGIYEDLREMILNFSLYPGSRITENELAEAFGVSRTPIRAALQRLEAEGYLTILPKQGCYIRDLDIKAIAGFYQVRISLEMLSLENACHFMTDADLHRLADLWQPEQAATDELSSEDMEAFDESFHISLAEGGGNMALRHFLNDINSRIRIIRRLDFTDRGRIDTTFEEHFGICQHLLRRDLGAAKRMMRAHIKRSQEFAMNLTLMELARKRPVAAKI